MNFSDTEARGRCSNKGVVELEHNRCHLRQIRRFSFEAHEPRFQ